MPGQIIPITIRSRYNTVRKKSGLALGLFISSFITFSATAQLREMHAGTPDNIRKLNFFSPREGYAAFDKSIAFGTDSGRFFNKKEITLKNVNYNNYPVNLTFGFEADGVKAFDKSNIIVYGNYGYVPSIIKSTDEGNTFKVVFHSQHSTLPDGPVTDVQFPAGNTIGFAACANGVAKTNDGGETWTYKDLGGGNGDLMIQAISTTQLFVYRRNGNLMLRSIDGGATYQQVNMPTGVTTRCLYFITASKIILRSTSNKTYLTTTGGLNWAEQAEPAQPLEMSKMVFVNDSTGYALTQFEVYKTSNSGKIWERIPRITSYATRGLAYIDLQIINTTLFAAGGRGLLVKGDNLGGVTIPAALFKIDTSALTANSTIKLVNQSRSGYKYTWLVNNKVISSAYNASYQANIYGPNDSVKLIVSNNLYADTTVLVTEGLNKGPFIHGFEPAAAATGTKVIIDGRYLNDATGVSFGGVPAASFKITKATTFSTTIEAIVGAGASGDIAVTTTKGIGAKAGFTYYSPPVITSFSPAAAPVGATVTLTGKHFNGVSAITINDNPVTSFTVISPTEIKLVVNATLSGNISVKALGGTDVKPGFVLIPTITTASPTISYGSALYITGTGLLGVKSVTIDGYPTTWFDATSTEVRVNVGEGNLGLVKISTADTSATVKVTYFLPPKITSFSPLSGPAGTIVTITGSNFSPVIADNIVYFGTQKAVVTAATATSLSVAAPVGANYKPICVISNKNMGFSAVPFVLTFNTTETMSATSFGSRFDITLGSQDVNVVLADLNNDNKPEIILPMTGSTGDISTLKANNSTPGAFKFDHNWLKYSRDAEDGIWGLDILDWDMDGKLDLVAAGIFNSSYDEGAVNVLTNISLGNGITYASGRSNITALPRGNPARSIVASDFDGDGRPDWALGQITNRLSNMIQADLNNDGKAELIYRNTKNLSVYKNVSVKGSITHAPPQYYDLGNDISSTATADLDNDGKLEIIASLQVGSGGAIKIFKNTGTASNITLTEVLNMPLSTSTSDGQVADMDGDGKPDYILITGGKVSVFKNTTKGGVISFAAPLEFTGASAPTFLRIADMDADGRPDIFGMIYNQGNAWILRNQISGSSINSFTPLGGASGTTVTITGKGFTGATAVALGSTPVRSFTVNSDTNITAVIGDGAYDYFTITTPNDVINSSTVFAFVPVPKIVYYSPLFFAPGGSVGLVADPNRPAAYTYQWAKDGVDIPGETKINLVVKTSGSYTVSIVGSGSAPQVSAPVITRVVYSLPASNFQLKISSVTCKGSSNGVIDIKAEQALKYTATISGGNLNKSYPFTTALAIPQLPGGNYDVCITVEGQADYKQCFSVVITEPKDLAVYSVVNPVTNIMSLQLSGGSVYSVKLNDQTYITTSARIDLPLTVGVNRVKVTAENICQGVYEQEINTSDDLKPYPSPFNNTLNINLGTKIIKQARVKITGLNNGRSYFNQRYTQASGTIQLNVADLMPGFYIITITVDGRDHTFKILK